MPACFYSALNLNTWLGTRQTKTIVAVLSSSSRYCAAVAASESEVARKREGKIIVSLILPPDAISPLHTRVTAIAVHLTTFRGVEIGLERYLGKLDPNPLNKPSSKVWHSFLD